MARILIADDSITNLQYVKEALKETAHEIITAMDGEEAEQKVRSENFDLIMLDIVMPKKSGFQVCRSLKRDEKFKHIPIIMITSKSQESDRFWGLRQGADEYITKPFEPIDVLIAVKKHLRKE